jgi:hypothetical protein
MPIALSSHLFGQRVCELVLRNRDAQFNELLFAALRSTGIVVTVFE